MRRGKIVLDGKSKENLEKNCGIQFFFLVFLSFWTVCDYPKLKQQQRLRFRERLALFGEKSVRFLRNRFGCVKISDRLWENQQPTFGKSATGFGKMSSGDAWKFETTDFKHYV